MTHAPAVLGSFCTGPQMYGIHEIFSGLPRASECPNGQRSSRTIHGGCCPFFAASPNHHIFTNIPKNTIVRSSYDPYPATPTCGQISRTAIDAQEFGGRRWIGVAFARV